jgi:hypothetical protein
MDTAKTLMKTTCRNRRIPGRNRKGVALIIVLAFVVLLTGLIIAFFSRSILDRQISNSSVSRGKVSAFADGVTDSIIGELKQEIVLSSSATPLTAGTVTSGTLYTPLTPAAMLPQLSGTSGITWTGSYVPYNLLKLSSPTQPFYSGANGTIPASGSSNAIAVSSTTPSLNGRYFTPAYWNAHYLLPTVSSTDSTPYTSGAITSFVPPSWVLVARDGSNPTPSTLNSGMTTSGTNPVVGRYAFAIYHEGGLLDVNAAGYPVGSGSAAVIPNVAYKPALAYADLTQLPGGLTTGTIDKLVAWRNFASIPVPNSSFLTPGFTVTSGSNYYNMVISNTTGYLGVSGTAVNPTTNQTDQMFTSRQELIKFFQNALGVTGTSLNVLNYLTTFTRDINQPTYIPPVQSSTSAPVVLAPSLGGNSAYYQSPGYSDKLINPSFPTVRVQASFTRNDGSMANVGDPLVNKRFALQRLAWITYKGPSADVIQTSGTSDPSIQPLIADGIPYSYLQLGTDANIKSYFGLSWDSSNNRWNYNVNLGNNGTNNLIMLVGRPAGTGSNANTYVEDANRDPNFFELLKAGIAVGSLGKAAASSATSVSQSQTPSGYSYVHVPVNERYAFDTSVDYHVIQIGANILSEVNPTSYPVRITFNDGSARGNWEFQGVTDLPYLSYVFNGVLRTQLPNPPAPNSWADSSPFQYSVATTGTALAVSGSAYMVQVPAVWNPYDPNGTPGVLRPSQFRILVDSNDPVTLSGSGSSTDVQLWHGAEASNSIAPNVGGGSGNQGLTAPGPIYSYQVSGGAGDTTEKPGNGGTVLGIGTPVSDGVTFGDGGGALYREPTLIFNTNTSGSATRVNAMTNPTGPATNITGIDSSPLPNDPGDTGPWAPLVIGQMPLAFSAGAGTSGTTYYTGLGLIGNAAGTIDDRVYFTYRLQYQDPSRNWVTYDTKYGRTTDGMFSYQEKNGCSPTVTVPDNGFDTYSWASAIDPRSARFGLISDTMNTGRISAEASGDPPSVGWIFNAGSGATNGTTTVGITYPIRQDNSGGFGFVNLDSFNTPPGATDNDKQSGFNGFHTILWNWTSFTYDIPYPSFSAGWTCPLTPISVGFGEVDVWMFAPGMYAQNNPGAPFVSGGTIEPSYYADADGVVRRGAGAYVGFGATISGTSPVGLPPASIQGYTGAVSSLVTPAGATPLTQSQSRPLLLHRPFRTVAELGYVFRDVPWKNLDFFTPESGDAGLLDLFCINETASPASLVAGKVNLNTRQAPVLAAIISGACVDDPKVTNATVGSVSPSVASTIATALTTRTSETTNNGPLQNLSELVGKWHATNAASGPVTYTPTDQSGSSGIDLPSASGYMDGRLSYTGYSGAPSVSGTVDNLTDAYAIAFSSTASKLQTSMSQVMRFREAPIRALASVGQTRVWNLMIDVVAQTGRYPTASLSTSNPLAAFNVEGQQHYWVHVAIDRLTGQVLDKQIEVVKE